MLYESREEVIAAAERRCAACGEAAARRLPYCPVCDKLMAEDYQPLDTIRSAHGLQRKTLFGKGEEQLDLFDQKKNTMSETAWACVVYSMVPYLGMLFIPFAVITGGLGYAVAIRQPHLGGRRLAVICVGTSLVILALQLLLWWLLYLIPELNVPKMGSS